MRAAGLVSRTSGENGMNCVNKASGSGFGRPRTVYVRKDQYLVSLVQPAQVLDIVCKNKSGFNILTSTVKYLLGSHNVSGFITLVDVEVPMDTYYALQNSEKQMISVMRSVFNVKNFTA